MLLPGKQALYKTDTIKIIFPMNETDEPQNLAHTMLLHISRNVCLFVSSFF